MAHSSLKWVSLLVLSGLFVFWVHHINESRATRIIVAKKIHTLEDDAPTAEAVAIDKHGKIMSIGSKGDVFKYKGWFTKVESFPDSTVLPGFVDPHMHTELATTASWIDIGTMDDSPAGGCPTIDAAFQKLKAGAEDFFLNNKLIHGWVLAHHLSPSLQSDNSHMKRKDITLDLLDSVTPHPLLIEEANGHFAYANKAAFEKAFPDKRDCLWAANSSACLPDPEGGLYERSADGHLTGRVAESPGMEPFLEAIKGDIKVPGGYFTIIRSIGDIYKRASRHGVTSIQDMGLGLATGALQDTVLAEVALALTKPLVRLTGRVSVFANTSSLEGAAPFGPLVKIGHPGPFHKIHSLNGVKMWSDGSNQGQSGAQFEPYIGTNNTGKLNWNFSTIKDMVNLCNRNGWPLSVHANGDRAIDVTLQAFEAAESETCADGSCKRLRHRIEHASLANDTQLDMMQRLGVSPSFLIGHVYYYGKALREMLGESRINKLDRCASALARGLRISLHSDYDVTDIDPLRMIETAVVRNMKYADGILNPQERITRMQAVRAVTIDAAWQCHTDDITGSLKVGKYADLVILGADPFVVPETDIHSVEVQGTYFEGKRAYWKSTEAASKEAEAATCASAQWSTENSGQSTKGDIQSFAEGLLTLQEHARAAAECKVRHGDVLPAEMDNKQILEERTLTV